MCFIFCTRNPEPFRVVHGKKDLIFVLVRIKLLRLFGLDVEFEVLLVVDTAGARRLFAVPILKPVSDASHKVFRLTHIFPCINTATKNAMKAPSSMSRRMSWFIGAPVDSIYKECAQFQLSAHS